MSAAPHLHAVDSKRAEEPAQIPPHDLEAEAAVLSALLLAEQSIRKVEPFLRPEHFYSEAHRCIYDAVLAIDAADGVVDVVTVSTRLRKDERLARVGGMKYITEVLPATPAVANITQHAEIVYENARLRALCKAAQTMAAKIYAYRPGPELVQPFLEESSRTVERIARAQIRGARRTNFEILAAIIERINEKRRNRNPKAVGIPTGLAGYDHITGGLHQQQLTMLLGRSGNGKTTLAMQIANHVAKQGIGVLVFEQDQTEDEMVTKLVSLHARVDSKHIEKGELSQDEDDRISAVAGAVAELPIFWECASQFSIDDVRARSYACAESIQRVAGVPLGLIIFDYWQKSKGTEAEQRRGIERHERLANFAIGFKELIQELKVPGLVLAQPKPFEINPKTKTRPKPTEDDAEGSQQLKKEADVVTALWRNAKVNEYTGVPVGEHPTNLTFFLLKQRNGKATGEWPMKFEAEYSTFVPIVDAGSREDEDT